MWVVKGENMKNKTIMMMGMAAVLALSGCQNGVVATPFGDYGVKSRDGGRVTIGFINKKRHSLVAMRRLRPNWLNLRL